MTNIARSHLLEQGYYFTGDGRCWYCGVRIEWWVTPHDKKQPRDRGTLTPHHATCSSLRGKWAAKTKGAAENYNAGVQQARVQVRPAATAQAELPGMKHLAPVLLFRPRK